MFKQIIISCVLQNCGNVGCDKALALGNADDKRTFSADCKNSVGVVLEHNSERKRTLKLRHNSVNRFERISVIFVVKQLCNNLCVGVAQKFSAL